MCVVLIFVCILCAVSYATRYVDREMACDEERNLGVDDTRHAAHCCHDTLTLPQRGEGLPSTEEGSALEIPAMEYMQDCLKNGAASLEDLVHVIEELSSQKKKSLQKIDSEKRNFIHNFIHNATASSSDCAPKRCPQRGNFIYFFESIIPFPKQSTGVGTLYVCAYCS